MALVPFFFFFFASLLSEGQARDGGGSGGEKTEAELGIDGKHSKISAQLSS